MRWQYRPSRLSSYAGWLSWRHRATSPVSSSSAARRSIGARRGHGARLRGHEAAPVSSDCCASLSAAMRQ